MKKPHFLPQKHEKLISVYKVCMEKVLSITLATPWTVACQAPLSMELSRQEYWSVLPFPTPGDLPNPGLKLASLAYPTLAGRFFTLETHLFTRYSNLCADGSFNRCSEVLVTHSDHFTCPHWYHGGLHTNIWAAATGVLSVAKRSYPTSEVRGRSWEDPMPKGWRPRGITPRLRSGTVAESARLR